jgi:hypothetical protein
VTPWAEVPDNPFWAESDFRGASLAWDEIARADDQRAAVLEFFRHGRNLLRMLPAE